MAVKPASLVLYGRRAPARDRKCVSVAVFFGMLGVTLFGLMFTPIFYMIVRNLADSSRRADPAPAG
jgi:multidrug efflux pump subunit AcrB